MDRLARRILRDLGKQPISSRLGPNGTVFRCQLHRRQTPRTMSGLGSFFSQVSAPSSSLNGIITRGFSTYRGDPYITFAHTKRTVIALVALNAGVFGAWQYAALQKDRKLERFLYENFTLSWRGINDGRYWTIITSAFSHRDAGHFIFNMFGLWTFGTALASRLVPPMKLLGISMACALVGSCASLAQWRSQGYGDPRPKPVSQRVRGFSDRVREFAWPQNRGVNRITIVEHIGLGASGITMGLSAAAACLMPLAKGGILFIPIPIPLFVTTGLFIGYDLFLLSNQDSRVGHAAHLGGVAAGFLSYFAVLRNYGGIWPWARRLVLRR